MPCSTPANVEEPKITSDEGKFLWSSLLEEVTHKAAVTLSSAKTLVVMGDDECGKTTLIARLQNNEDPKKGFGLEYNLLDVKDEERDDQTKLNVWILDGNPVHSHLLKFAINEESFGDCVVMITVSMSEPWNIMDSLEKWTDILKKHVARLKLPDEALLGYKRNVLHQFCSYLEPDAIGGIIHTSIPASPHPSALDKTHKLSGIHPATAALMSSSDPTAQQVLDNDADFISGVKLLATENVLTNNLGIPLIVVMTKTDAMNTLAKSERFTEEHFDFIQMHIRRFCLLFGAALFYVSVKEDKNCDLLNRYIQNRIYGFPFTQSAYVVERDCIFVPAGWDNEKKIGIQVENLAQVHPQSPYSEVVPRPPPRKTVVRDQESHAQDEQSFLAGLLTQIQKNNAQPNQNGVSANPCSTDTNVEQLTSPPNITAVGNRPGSGSARTSVSSTRSKTNINVGEQVGAGIPGSGSSDSVLANFFNSLLSKKTSSAGLPGNTTSPPTASGLLSDKSGMSQLDFHSELERLASNSRDPLNSNVENQNPLTSNSPIKKAGSQSDPAAPSTYPEKFDSNE